MGIESQTKYFLRKYTRTCIVYCALPNIMLNGIDYNIKNINSYARRGI